MRCRTAALRRRGGFTLIELTASMLVAGLCIGATVSALHVVTTGGARLAQRSEAQAAVGIGVNRMIAELSMAMTVVSISSTGISFTHPDVTGDSVDDQITYAWSGTPGDPVTRKLNSNAAAAVISGAADFSLGVDVRNAAEEFQPDRTPELTVASHDIYPSIFVVDPKPVSNSEYVAEYFGVPNYPNSVACRITRVLISISANGARDRQLALTIERNQSGTYNPDGTALGRVDFDEADLPDAFQWRQFNFSGVEVPVGQGCTIVLRGIGGSQGAWVETHLLSVGLLDGMTLRYSSNAGTTWSPALLTISDMRFFVFGEYVLNTSSGTGSLASGTLESVHLHVQTAGDDPVVVDTAARCLNRPSLAGQSMAAVPTR
ncbi:MAG: hypothetical protein C4547_05395 [Phycisphaerales bacterium]|nr:MAG: hypothetical protein C4547_05395 [Phycisphaerales bacterium]